MGELKPGDWCELIKPGPADPLHIEIRPRGLVDAITDAGGDDPARRQGRGRLRAVPPRARPGTHTPGTHTMPPAMTLRPPGPELYEANLRRFARIESWPPGTVETLLALQAEFPGWRITWSTGGHTNWREPGFYAWPSDWRTIGTVHRKDLAQLREVLESCPVVGWHSGWAPPGGWLRG